MDTKVLLDKIAETHATQLAAITADTQDQVAAIEAEAAQAVAKIEADAAVLADKTAAQISRATLARARQSGKLVAQTAKREAFDVIMKAAETTLVAGGATEREFSDKRAKLELHLAQQLQS
jgi:precorrin-6B methylase 2